MTAYFEIRERNNVVNSNNNDINNNDNLAIATKTDNINDQSILVLALYAKRQCEQQSQQQFTTTTNEHNNDFSYLARRSAAPDENLELRVLESSPILESFGNARTLRNDNSSRFGKFLKLRFTSGEMSHLDGASVEPYLLEKSRVLAQGEGERNFHILYELVAGAVQDGTLAKELKVQCARPPAAAVLILRMKLELSNGSITSNARCAKKIYLWFDPCFAALERRARA